MSEELSFQDLIFLYIEGKYNIPEDKMLKTSFNKIKSKRVDEYYIKSLLNSAKELDLFHFLQQNIDSNNLREHLLRIFDIDQTIKFALRSMSRKIYDKFVTLFVENFSLDDLLHRVSSNMVMPHEYTIEFVHETKNNLFDAILNYITELAESIFMDGGIDS